MRVELDPIGVPHGQLLLRVAAVRPSRRRVPRPHLVLVEEVEVALQIAGREVAQLADEVAVDVVRMHFVFDERPVDEDVGHADANELIDEDGEVVDELAAPRRVPARQGRRRTDDEHRRLQLAEGELVVAGRKKAFVVERSRKIHRGPRQLCIARRICQVEGSAEP